ncbi:MAG: hypothetical protein D6725_00715 [Planctomycetota bacterium]|nr:MAG: hypothetical protein D6725_00715 [Planctomycetota bacterium]
MDRRVATGTQFFPHLLVHRCCQPEQTLVRSSHHEAKSSRQGHIKQRPSASRAKKTETPVPRPARTEFGRKA